MFRKAERVKHKADTLVIISVFTEQARQDPLKDLPEVFLVGICKVRDFSLWAVSTLLKPVTVDTAIDVTLGQAA